MLALFLLLYLIVALVNYSLVQSYVGSAASSYFSAQWGGKVKIGAISCHPFNHLILRDVLLVSPTNDTICKAGRVTARFDKFPIDNQGLSVKYVKLKDTYYHFKIDDGLNINYIIDYFKSEKEKEEEGGVFKVLVNEVDFDNFTYRQDLKDKNDSAYGPVLPWVDIKHMEYRNINGRILNVRVDGGDVTCRIDRMSFTEKCGLQLVDLKANVYVTNSGISATQIDLQTADSRVIGDVLIDYCSWKSMKHFMDSVFFTCNLESGSYCGMRDASYWASALWGMDERLYVTGMFYGPLSDFHADNVDISFGSETKMELSASISGLPNMDSTMIMADVRQLHTTYSDLKAVRHPKGVEMKAESIIKTLGPIDLTATFNGSIYDFDTKFEVQSTPGTVKGALRMSMNPKKNQYFYKGSVTSKDFYFGRISPNEWVSRSGFDMSFDGDGFDPKEMKTTLEGRLHHIMFHGEHLIGEMAIDASASGGAIYADVSLDDVLGKLLLHADVNMTEDYPEYSVNLDVEHLDLKRLGLWTDTNDTEARIFLHADANYKSSFDGYTDASMSMNNLSLRSTTHHYRVENVNLDMTERNHEKVVTLESDIVNGKLRGYLEWDCIGQLVQKFSSDYLPSLNPEDERASELRTYDKIADANFDLKLEWADANNMLNMLVPQLNVASGTSLHLNYNFIESFKTVLTSDSLKWGDVAIYHLGLDGETQADHYTLRLRSQEIMVGKMLLSDNANLRVESSSQGVWTYLTWENESPAIGDGTVALRVERDSGLMSLLLEPSHISVGGTEWNLGQRGTACLSKNGWWINGLDIYNGAQSLEFSASRQGTDSDSILLKLDDFEMGIFNPFLKLSNISASGIANGIVSMGGFSEVPYLNADLAIGDLAINDEQIGNAKLHSSWDSEMNQLNLDLEAGTDSNGRHNIMLEGFASLGQEDPDIDFRATLSNMDLKLIEPFISSFSSDFSGKVSANLDIAGTLQSPIIEGPIYLDNLTMLVNLLGVAFSSSDTIKLEENAILFENFEVNDSRGGSMTVSGSVNHYHLKDISLDLNVHSDGLLCLNTNMQQSESYFGKVIASIDGSVTGPVDDISVRLDATTLDGSTLNVPINDKRQMKQADYIHFESDYDIFSDFFDDNYARYSGEYGNENQSQYVVTTAQPSSSRFDLQITVNVTPDMQIHLPMDFSTIEADVKATGGGELHLGVGTDNPFSINGIYEMIDGSFLVELAGVVNKEFSIGEGSTINFPGSVSDAEFDIRAVYSQKVNLATLTGSQSSAESQKMIQVQNIISMKGKMQSPDITFDIELPDADQSVKDEVFAYIDRNNERDMITQTVYLLMGRSFYSSSSSVTDVGTTAVTDGGYGLLFSTLGSFANDIVSFVDLNVDYQSGNSMTKEQVNVGVNKEWKKFYFETLFGFGGESREMSGAGKGNNMTGDMLVGYKINPRFHLFVFNRSNNNDYTRSDLPYKQGVGLKYTRDFDNFTELFKKKR